MRRFAVLHVNGCHVDEKFRNLPTRGRLVKCDHKVTCREVKDHYLIKEKALVELRVNGRDVLGALLLVVFGSEYCLDVQVVVIQLAVQVGYT